MRSIMVVDDDTFCLSSVKEMLSPHYRVALLISPLMALDAVQKLKPDLVITDYSMPELNGDELIERLKADPLTAELPIIAISGGDLNSLAAQRSLAAGARAYLKKPVEPKTLLGAIDACLAVD